MFFRIPLWESNWPLVKAANKAVNVFKGSMTAALKPYSVTLVFNHLNTNPLIKLGS